MAEVDATGAAEGQRLQRHLLRRVRWITRKAGDAHHSLVLGVERLERGLFERPVIGDAIEGSHVEVRGMEAREVAGMEDRAATDAVEVRHLDG